MDAKTMYDSLVRSSDDIAAPRSPPALNVIGNNKEVAPPSYGAAAQHYDALMRTYGYDPTSSSSLVKTPTRAAKAMAFLTSGTNMKAEDVLNGAIFDLNEDLSDDVSTTESDDYEAGEAAASNDMVVVHGITFYSLCEHHLLPFFGTVHIAYIPQNGRVLGLSKLPRLVQVFSRRLQVQERLTSDIARAIEESTGARGVAVTIDARHMCVEMRGVEQNCSVTSTRVMRGAFERDQALVNEFYNKISLSRSSSRM